MFKFSPFPDKFDKFKELLNKELEFRAEFIVEFCKLCCPRFICVLLLLF